MIIRVLQNLTLVEIDLGQCILVLDLVHRSQKALVEVSMYNIKMSTFALKLEGGNFSKKGNILVLVAFFPFGYV